MDIDNDTYIHELDICTERMIRLLRRLDLCDNKQKGYDIVRFVNNHIERQHGQQE